MAVLITAVVPGQTQEGYDAAMRTLRPLLEQANGFIGHGAGMSPEGWRVFEIWETQQQAVEFFAVLTVLSHHRSPGTAQRLEIQVAA
jgi:hypothetical protein